jgi:hypothetical protein
MFIALVPINTMYACYPEDAFTCRHQAVALGSYPQNLHREEAVQDHLYFRYRSSVSMNHESQTQHLRRLLYAVLPGRTS